MGEWVGGTTTRDRHKDLRDLRDLSHKDPLRRAYYTTATPISYITEGPFGSSDELVSRWQIKLCKYPSCCDPASKYPDPSDLLSGESQAAISLNAAQPCTPNPKP